MTVIIFLFVFIHSFIYTYSKYEKGKLNLFSYFVLWYGVIYGLIPIFYFVGGKDYMLPMYWPLIGDMNFLLESFIVLVGYVSLFVGAKSYNKKGFKIVSNLGNKGDKLFNFSFFLFIIGILAYYYYIQLYGGLSYVLNNVSQIRSGTDENKNYLGAIIRMFSSFIVYSFIIVIFLFYKNYFKKSKIKFLFFIAVTSSLVLTALLDGGRANMIVKFIYIFLAIYFLRGKIKKRYILLVASIAMFIVFFGKTFIFSMFSTERVITFSEVNEVQNSIGYSNLVVYEFNHQFLSLSNYIQNEHESRYLKDYIIWALKPLKLIDGNSFYDSISYYNTYLISGYWGSDIPPGFLALAFINGGILVVIIQNLIIGRFIRFLDVSFYSSNFKENGVLFFIYMYLFNYLWFALQNGDIALIIQSGLVFIVFFTYLFFTKKIKFYRNV